MRNRSFGFDSYNFFDFLGNKLSEIKFSKILPINRDANLDLGSGYHAKLRQSVRKKFKHSVLLAVSISPELNNSNELIIGDAHEVIYDVQDSSQDFCIANNVLEHLKQPDLVLATLKSKMKKNSVIYIFVPNWNGKKLLELGAFKLRFLSFEEMNDHKFYFSKKELWLLRLRSGFQPANISIKTIKFGLCTQSVIRLNLS